MNGFRVLALVLAVGFCAGCDKPAAPMQVAAGGGGEPTQAQPKLQTLKLWIGAEEMTVELALTPIQQQTGMMFRTNLAENAGMLFPLPFTQRASFWMKNCPLPLSAAYIDPDGIIQELHEFQPHNTNAVIAASSNIRFVLETPKGWFQRHNVKPGMLVKTENGSLMDTFFKTAR